MVFKNVTDLMKRHTALFVILLISQIFALLSIFFVFGVFQNNLYELCDNHDSKSLEATIDNQKITSDDINKIFMTMVEEEIPIDYFYVEAESKDGKKSFLDRAQYKNGKYGYSDSVYENMKYGLQGSYYEDKDYRNKNKVVVINGEDKKDVGDTIVLGEETFDIIGKDDINDPGEYEIPFTAFPKNCVWIRLNFGLTQLPTRAQYETFRDLLLSYGCKPAEFYVSNNADLRQEYSMLVVSALLAILAGVNMYMIYRFIFKKRRKKLAVFLLCGCSKKRARMLFFTEILCNMLCVVIVATGLFRFVVFPQMLTWFKYVDRIYGIKEYGTIIGIFLFVVLLIGYALSFSITRKSILDFKRGEL